MGTSSWLSIIRRLAVIAVVLSVLLVPVGLFALRSALSPDIGDNELGDAIALGAGIALLILAASGTVLGLILAALAKRAMADPREDVGRRRRLLRVGLVMAGLELVISIIAGGGLLIIIVPIVGFALGFLMVAASARPRGTSVVSAAFAIGLLGLSILPVWAQTSQLGNDTRRDARVDLLPDMSSAIEVIASVAPDGWNVVQVSVRITDFAPTAEIGYLPTGLGTGSLRGLVVLDCAGAASVGIATSAEDGSTMLGTAPCDAAVHVVPIDIPQGLVRAGPPPHLAPIEVGGVGEGSSGGMNRAVVLVADADTPLPDNDILQRGFVAVFGTERPR